MILLADVFSSFHKNGNVVQYGRKGEKVTIISEHGVVLTVEGKERFPIRREQISD